jgi:hypothetical protein
LQHDHFAGKLWHKVKDIAFDVFSALAHMHSKGMVHGDVSGAAWWGCLVALSGGAAW